MMSKQKADLLQGTLDLLILKALSLGPMHGYGVGQRIMQMAEELLKIEEGSLYPALYRLEEKEWITPAGRKQLNIEEENWQRFALAMGKVLRTA
jgi:PadR family transcriptional regulator, regulatory protein PadR